MNDSLPSEATPGLSPKDRFVKRSFDVVLSLSALTLTWWVILAGLVVATLDTGRWGLFRQPRVGRNGRAFQLLKLRTMRDDPSIKTTVTTARDPRVTRIGRLLRRTRLDELPQLLNILFGEMSFVGPRPDVAGYADRLRGEDRVILTVRPGLTGPATLKYRREEELLARQPDPEKYNREVIFPEKVRLNRQYVENYGFTRDLILIWRTLTNR